MNNLIREKMISQLQLIAVVSENNCDNDSNQTTENLIKEIEQDGVTEADAMFALIDCKDNQEEGYWLHEHLSIVIDLINNEFDVFNM